MAGKKRPPKNPGRFASCVTVEMLLADIHAYCLGCSGGSRKMVETCDIQYCRLWKYRNGQAGIQTAMFSDADQLEGQLDMFGNEVQ